MPRPDDYNDLEQMLTDLPVREPSRMLDERVAQMLGRAQAEQQALRLQKQRVLRIVALAAVLMLAGVAVVVLLVLSRAHPDIGDIAGNPDRDPPTEQAEPEAPIAPDDGPAIRLANNPVDAVNLVWTRDIAEEMRYTPTGEPFRAVVREAIDTKTWSNPDTGEAGQLCIPREELIVVKQETF